MRIRIRKYSVLAYILVVSCSCLLLWVVIFILSDDVVSPLGSIDQTAEDRLSEDYEHNLFLQPIIRRDSDRLKRKYSDEEVKVSPPELVLIPESVDLHNMSWKELADLYHRYLNVNQLECTEALRVGHITDGGWDVCTGEGHTPKAPCLVYSFGIGNDFSFDDAVTRQFGCQVFSFDPSMNMESGKRSEKSMFYKQGIADSDRTLPNGWQMSRFESIRASLKHMKTAVSIVKLDIEEWEWEVLPDMLASGQLTSVQQVLVELHQCEGCATYNPEQEDKEPPRHRYIHMLEILRDLHKLNFRIFHHHSNPACNYLSRFTLMPRSACLEVGFVRVS